MRSLETDSGGVRTVVLVGSGIKLGIAVGGVFKVAAIKIIAGLLYALVQ